MADDPWKRLGQRELDGQLDADDAEWLLDEIRRCKAALAGVVSWLETHGRLENHGHRRPGSACEECRVVNAAQEAARGS